VDQLERGNERNHEATLAVDCKVESSIGGLERRLDGTLSLMREEVTQMREEMGSQL